MEGALTKAVDTLSSQLKEKDALLHDLQKQLKEREGYIAQLHQVIVASGSKVPEAPKAATTEAAATSDASAKLSKNQKKKQKRQQQQEQGSGAAEKVTPLKQQAAPTPATTGEAPATASAPATPEDSKKRKRAATKGTEAKSPVADKGAASPAKEKKQETPKKEQTPKKDAAKSPVAKPKESKNVKTLKNGLKLEDTVIGTGKQATLGKRVSVLYKGFLTNGKSFDSSLNKPFTFRLGVGEVIKGWDTGVVGMKVGGRRKLVIPAKLGYGRQSMPGIPANSTLLFEVELVDVK